MSDSEPKSMAWRVGMKSLKGLGVLSFSFVVFIISLIVFHNMPPQLFTDIMTAPKECERTERARAWGNIWTEGRSWERYTCDLSKAELEEYLDNYVSIHEGTLEKYIEDEPKGQERFVYSPEDTPSYVVLRVLEKSN